MSKLSFDIEANCKERDVFYEALRKETKISGQNGSAPKDQGKRAKRQEKHENAEASCRSSTSVPKQISDQESDVFTRRHNGFGFDVRYF